MTVNLQPRYPLFGGWSTKFLFGWSLPLSKAVSKVRCKKGGGGMQGQGQGPVCADRTIGVACRA